MFGIGWSELLLVAVVAIVAIGPKDLPRAMRYAGQWSGKLKRLSRDFQGQFNEAIREAGLDEIRNEVAGLGSIEPLNDLRRSMTGIETGIQDHLAVPASPPTATTAPVLEART